MQFPICDHNCITRITGFILAVAEEQVTYKEGIRATLQEVAIFKFLGCNNPSRCEDCVPCRYYPFTTT